jgi:transposase-like protein
MSRHAPDPALIECVRIAIESGASLAEVAELAGVAKATVAKWCKQHGFKPRTVAPQRLKAAIAASAATDAEPPAQLEWGDDLLANAKQIQQQLMASAVDARNVGNLTAAQRFMRDASNQSAVIARLEALHREGSDVLHASRADIAAADARNHANLKRLLDRPLLCAHCGRALSADMGDGREDKPKA